LRHAEDIGLETSPYFLAIGKETSIVPAGFRVFKEELNFGFLAFYKSVEKSS
jgi:hypothetical protein